MNDKERLDAAVSRATDTKRIDISPRAVRTVGDVFRHEFAGVTPLIIADQNTYRVAGAEAYDILKAAGLSPAEPYVFPGTPQLHPDFQHVETVAELLQERDAIGLAVGSGTINDIVKLASDTIGRRYMVVATAASVDGYASYGASILRGGYKSTIPCAAPQAVLADADVLLSAPYEMSAAGYADLLGKVTAGADWIIADGLGVEPVDSSIWDMVQAPLATWTATPKALKTGDLTAFSRLFTGLTVSALAMQAYRDTRPASGTEHLFSHVWEMQNLEVQGVPVSHGFKVGIGTLAATALMEVLFSQDIGEDAIAHAVNVYPGRQEREEEVRRQFADSPFTDAVVNASLQKQLTSSELESRIRTAKERWKTLRDRVRSQLSSYHEIRDMLIDAGCPHNPAQIGVSRDRLTRTFRLAQMIRTRYTVLDLAYELGLLDRCVAAIFADETYFPL